MHFRWWLLPVFAAATLACVGPAPGPTAGPRGGDSPRSGGTLNVRVPDDPDSWDLSLFKTMPAWEGHTLAYNSL